MVDVLRDVLEISRIQKLRKELETPRFSTLLLEGIKVTFRRLIVLGLIFRQRQMQVDSWVRLFCVSVAQFSN